MWQAICDYTLQGHFAWQINIADKDLVRRESLVQGQERQKHIRPVPQPTFQVSQVFAKTYMQNPQLQTKNKISLT